MFIRLAGSKVTLGRTTVDLLRQVHRTSMTEHASAGIYAREYESIDTVVELGVAGDRVIAVRFPADSPSDAGRDHPLLDHIGAAIEGSMDALETLTTADVGLTLATDRRRVLEALRSVPVGQSVSVSRLTRLAGSDPNDADDLETVAAALRTNPVPILVPDHRVDGGPYATPGPVREALRRAEGH